MTTNVKVFKSTDTGAPALTGQAGSLLALLDAVLIDGYNPGSVTSITRDGSTATATRAGHGFQDGDCVLNAGADQAEYNGEFYISNVTPDTFDFTVSGTPATPATGTITAKRAPAGWTRPYSGSNLAAYRQGGGNQLYLRVDDTGTTTGRVVGYESMSDVNTGTSPFPTNTQVSGGLYWSKSSTADATARPWVIAATDRVVYVLINSNSDATGSTSFVGVFADIKSYKSGDAFGTLILGGVGSSPTTNNTTYVLAAVASSSAGHYMARSHTQLGASLQVGKHSDAAKAGAISPSMGGQGLPYPNPADGGLYLAPVFIHEPNIMRGELPGLWNPLHNRPLQHLDTFSGMGALAGKTFLAFNMYSNAQLFLETSNTWSL
jgi:hypothetical protein